MKTNGTLLSELLEKAMRNGEVPYQSNRKAAEKFDIDRDRSEGKQHLLVMLEGLDIFIADLEAFENATEQVAQQSSRAVQVALR